MDKLTRIAFSRLFEWVNERFSIDYTDKTGWAYSHQWTTKERDSYVQWLATFLAKEGFDQKQSEMDAMFFVHKNGWQINDKPREARF